MSNKSHEIDHDMEERLARRLLDVFIRAGVVLALVLLCHHFFSPFLTMMLWALILSVTLYPLHQMLANRMGGRQGCAATLIVLLGIGLIVSPTVMLASSFGDSVHHVINGVKDNTLAIPAPPQRIAEFPVVGKKAYAAWSKAHNDLPGFVKSMQPKVGELAGKALGIVASLGGGILMFLFAVIIAGIMMAFGEPGARAMLATFQRIAGIARGDEFTRLATSTVRAVAAGVLGIACMQALLIGVALLIAGVPFAGVLAVIVLVLGIVQVPAAIVTLPVIAWIWLGGDYETTSAIAYTVLLMVSGSADNILKPMVLGRGVDAPMPVILLGALGGMATDGILGMFVGAVTLAVGYQLFMTWVADNPARGPAHMTSEPGSMNS
jgi:predicted PurR-regulated permease PerM